MLPQWWVLMFPMELDRDIWFYWYAVCSESFRVIFAPWITQANVITSGAAT
jgi:hypothetical protein